MGLDITPVLHSCVAPLWYMTIFIWPLRPACAFRVFSLHPLADFRPPVLAGHVDTPMGVFFAGELAPALHRNLMHLPHNGFWVLE